MYDRYWLHLYANEPRLATHEARRPSAAHEPVSDRVLEAFSRWLEGMEEALDRRAAEACVTVCPRVLPLD
jgi:hypothetical protein